MTQKWKKFTRRRCWKIFPEAMFFSFEKTFFTVSAQNLCHHFTWYHWLRKFSFIFQPIMQSFIPELWSCNFALLSPIPFSWHVNEHFCFAWSMIEDWFFPWFVNLYFYIFRKLLFYFFLIREICMYLHVICELKTFAGIISTCLALYLVVI